MEYKAIGFDYGGVIVGKPISGFYLALSKILNVDSVTLKKVYFENNYLMNIGGESYEDMWRKILVILGKTQKEKEIVDFIREEHNLEINSEVINIIKILRERGYKTGILSNNSTRVNKEIKDLDLDKFFDVVLISEDIGYMKPDPKVFEIFCEKLNINKEELIFIDDSEVSLKNADTIGFTPVLFENAEDLKIKLEELNVL